MSLEWVFKTQQNDMAVVIGKVFAFPCLLYCMGGSITVLAVHYIRGGGGMQSCMSWYRLTLSSIYPVTCITVLMMDSSLSPYDLRPSRIPGNRLVNRKTFRLLHWMDDEGRCVYVCVQNTEDLD